MRKACVRVAGEEGDLLSAALPLSLCEQVCEQVCEQIERRAKLLPGPHFVGTHLSEKKAHHVAVSLHVVLTIPPPAPPTHPAAYPLANHTSWVSDNLSILPASTY